ncbi:MAG: CCA tRNA nucleotidyltransferase [Clostridiales bacterium]|nr:CCA tRNA nucleotidyltransferase [Clostridiales bacterium]MBS5877614.1 CCA tRNA nucleotidyltransferase [Clostridiales bacterium]MDU0939499.1 CCA tRNA nucleotidyltransferase [Clostridiales bacterium]MDU1042031.1 CCA tRNA nucleotidyltransferase [Clostridiales bacterium]
MNIELPEDVRSILSKLEREGYDAYVVGGCVRDTLLGKEPEDWDITTSAKPEEIKKAFVKTVDTGIKHGTVTVIINGNGYEVTTYRIDGEYKDGRHPEEVRFTRSLRDDLNRRDFTINAIAYNDSNGLKDLFYGRSDLHNRIIRAVGNPEYRFKEDALRMMRAIRFSAQLGFNIDIETYHAIIRCSHLIKQVSVERIQTELTKTLMSVNPEAVKEYQLTGLFIEILPEINKILASRESQKVCALLKKVPNTIAMKYAALLSPLEADAARSVLKGLRLDNNTVNTVTQIIYHSKNNGQIDENDIAVREAIYKLGPRLMENLFVFEAAQIQMKEDVTGLTMRGARNHLKTIMRIYEEVLSRGDCVTIRDLDVTGSDLLKLGLSGKQVGETLEWLIHIVLENPKLNDKSTLLAMVGNI